MVAVFILEKILSNEIKLVIFLSHREKSVNFPLHIQTICDHMCHCDAETKGVERCPGGVVVATCF